MVFLHRHRRATNLPVLPQGRISEFHCRNVRLKQDGCGLAGTFVGTMADQPMDLLSDPVPVPAQAAQSTALVPAKSPERDKGGKAGGLRIGGRKAAPVGTTERGLVVPQPKIVTTAHETRKKVCNERTLFHVHFMKCNGNG